MAFSVSKSDVERVCKYIIKQPDHLPVRSRFGEGRP